MKNNDIIITIGRMNPPTTGHMKLIEQMMVTALETNVKKIYIILSGTLHKDTDPIKCIDKQELLVTFIIDKVKNNIIEKQTYTNTQINEIDVNIICMDDPRINANNSIIPTIKYIINESNTSNIQLIIGKDRATSYNWIQKYIKPVKLYDEPIVVNRNSKDQETEGMSATKMRKLANDGKFEEFSKEMIPTGIDAKNIKEIYDTIRDPKIPESNKSRKTKRTSESTEKKLKKTKAGKKTYKKKRVNKHIHENY